MLGRAPSWSFQRQESLPAMEAHATKRTECFPSAQESSHSLNRLISNALIGRANHTGYICSFVSMCPVKGIFATFPGQHTRTGIMRQTAGHLVETLPLHVVVHKTCLAVFQSIVHSDFDHCKKNRCKLMRTGAQVTGC